MYTSAFTEYILTETVTWWVNSGRKCNSCGFMEHWCLAMSVLRGVLYLNPVSCYNTFPQRVDLAAGQLYGCYNKISFRAGSRTKQWKHLLCFSFFPDMLLNEHFLSLQNFHWCVWNHPANSEECFKGCPFNLRKTLFINCHLGISLVWGSALQGFPIGLWADSDEAFCL